MLVRFPSSLFLQCVWCNSQPLDEKERGRERESLQTVNDSKSLFSFWSSSERRWREGASHKLLLFPQPASSLQHSASKSSSCFFSLLLFLAHFKSVFFFSSHFLQFKSRLERRSNEFNFGDGMLLYLFSAQHFSLLKQVLHLVDTSGSLVSC